MLLRTVSAFTGSWLFWLDCIHILYRYRLDCLSDLIPLHRFLKYDATDIPSILVAGPYRTDRGAGHRILCFHPPGADEFSAKSDNTNGRRVLEARQRRSGHVGCQRMDS